MNDNITKFMQSLDLDYSKAILSTLHFGQQIESLDKQLQGMKGIAMQTAKDINSAFASQLGSGAGAKTLVDQYGNAFKSVQSEAKKTSASLKDNANYIKQSTLEQIKAQAASVQQRVTTKKLSDDYSTQAKTIREQVTELQKKLQLSGKLSAEEIKQTQNLQEQLQILKQQTSANISDDIASGRGRTADEWNRRTSWFLSGTLFYGMINSGKQAVETIKDVEMGMVEIARIMDDSTFSFEGYRNQLLQLGVDYGQTFDTVQDIALRWAQAGYNVKDSLELTQTALLALNTAELDAANATESMIGIMAQWGLQAGDLELVIDKINKTADDYTVSSQDLVDGLLRSSAAAKNMNMTIEDTIALLTVMREASGRTGQEVGNALNSILSYVQRDSSINVLESMGIGVFTDSAKTQFRNAMDIFRDIAANWGKTSDAIKDGFVGSADDAGLFNEELAVALGLQEEWNDLQQRDIAQASAGVYRRNYYIGMIERMSNTQEILNNMMTAGGYSMRENTNTMDTLEKKYTSLKASVEQLAVALGDAGLLDMLKSVADGVTTLTQAFNSLPKPVKDFTLASLATIATVKTLGLGLKTLGLEIPNVSKTITALITGTTSLSVAMKTAATSTTAFIAANLPLLAISAVVGAIFAISNAYKRHQEETKQAIEISRQNIDSLKSEVFQLESLSQEYDKISSKTELSVDERKRLLEIQKELAQTYPQLTTALDEEGNALATNTNKIKEITEVKKKQLEQELLAQKILAQQDLPELRKELDETEKRITELSEKLQSGDTFETEVVYVARGMSYQKEVDKSKEYSEELLKLAETRKILTEDILKNEEAERLWLEVTEIAVENYRNGTQSVLDYSKATKELIDNVNEVSKDLSSLNQSIYDVRNGQSLSASTILDLIEKYDISANAIKKVSDGYTIEITALEELRQQKLKTTLDNIESTKLEVENEKLRLEGILQGYGLEIEQLKNLAEAKKEMAKVDERRANLLKMQDFNVPESAYTERQDAVSAYEDSIKKLEELEARANLIGNLANDPLFGVNNTKRGAQQNEQLSKALRLLEHSKAISTETQASIQLEIEQLKTINRLYAKTEEERMNMTERIYTAEKRLKDKRLQDSVNWINEKKNLDELSVDEEIAAWNRVLANQSNNIEAVKLANTNLYKLRKQQLEEMSKTEESSIKHLTTLGILSTKEQIKAYKELYSVKVESLSEEQSRIENLFNLYKKLLNEQQAKIKEAYDERIRKIDEEAEAEKAKKEERIKGLQEELDLLDRKDSQRSYEQTISDIRKEIEYWQVRTSEEARKKVIELEKQLDEEKYKRELELKKQSINDKIDETEDEIDEIERLANEEKEKWKKSYELTEKAFSEHSMNIVALAGAMSKEAYEQWEQNYLIPLQNALASGNFADFENLSNNLDSSIGNMETENAKIFKAANNILSLKKQWHDGDLSAADRAVQYYEQLRSLGYNGQSVASQLNAANYETAKDIVANLPRYHTGRFGGMEELAVLRKDEIVWPPELSRGMRALFPIIKNLGKNATSYDNRKEIKIEKLVNIENNYMEDDADEQSFAREVSRALNILV